MKIAVAMSGGIDSSVAAIILKEKGHDVTGITARLLDDSLMPGGSEKQEEIIERASRVAEMHGFPLHVMDLRGEFLDSVVLPFCREYLSGKTPNPCTRCNAMIKFSRLIQMADTLGCGTLATGHYSRIEKSPGGRFYISMGKERSKDQSYFLYMLSQQSLSRSMFPLGDYLKEEVYLIAEEHGMEVHELAESQEICFVNDDDYASFIESRMNVKGTPGDIVDSSGNVLGKHRGVHLYTIGQRRGMGISAPRPLYVTGIDAEKNRIIAGYREELNRKALLALEINFMKETGLDGVTAFVKTRSTQPPFRARLSVREGGIMAEFDEPQTGITPGQAAVFYDSNMGVLGGGIIARSLREDDI